MATTSTFMNYIVSQIRVPSGVRVLRMMGEYCLYYDNKVVALVCDNQFFLKDTPVGRALVPQIELAPAYPGAKNSLLISDVDNAELLTQLVVATAAILPAPQPKKFKGSTK